MTGEVTADEIRNRCRNRQPRRVGRKISGRRRRFARDRRIGTARRSCRSRSGLMCLRPLRARRAAANEGGEPAVRVLHPPLGMEPAHCHDAERNKDHQHDDLRDQEWRLRLGWRQRV